MVKWSIAYFPVSFRNAKHDQHFNWYASNFYMKYFCIEITLNTGTLVNSRLAQSVKSLNMNLKVVGSYPTVGKTFSFCI